MGSLVTVTVTNSVTLLYGSQGSLSSPLTVLNLDLENTVYVGNASNITAGGVNAIPLGPLASMSFDGSVSVYAVTGSGSLSVGVLPGGDSYSAGSLTITGPVTAEITGPIEVEGNVGITGTPSVSVSSGTVDATVTGSVEITGTPSVGISGVVDVTFDGVQDVVVNSGSVEVSNTVSTEVTNSPSVTVTSGDVTVAGTVSIGNTPAVTIDSGDVTAVISGTVDVQFPTAQDVVVNSGSVEVSNTVSTEVTNSPSVTVTSGDVTVAGTVSIGNTPAVTIDSGDVTAVISGTVDVQFPTAQDVVVNSGSVEVSNTVSTEVTNSPSVTVTSGDVTVAGTVSIGNTPAVTIDSGDVTATISGDVTIAAGTVDATIQNASIGVNVIPSEALLTTWDGTQDIPGPGSYTLLALTNVINYESYDILVDANDVNQTTAAHSLTFQVVLNWYADSAGGYPVGQEIWNPWVTFSDDSIPTMGSGPMRGSYLEVIVYNNGLHSISLVNGAVFGSPRTCESSQWTQNVSDLTVADAVLQGIINHGNGSDNMLADTGSPPTLTESAGYWLPFNLGAGECWASIEWVSSGNLSSAQIIDIGAEPMVSGSISGAESVVYQFDVTDNTPQGVMLVLPRSACALKVTTGADNGTLQFKCSLIR